MDKHDIERQLQERAQLPPFPTDDETEGRRSAASRLVEIASQCELFHDDNRAAYARFEEGGALVTQPVRGKEFRLWIAAREFDTTGKIPRTPDLADALSAIEGFALFRGAKRQVYRRLAFLDGVIYLDLCDDHWRVVEISDHGWRILERSPVPFLRGPNAKSLPAPVSGGSINELRPFLNVADDTGFMLCVAWLLGTLRPRGPYPLLRLYGPAGSAKTTATMLMRSIVDPAKAPVRTAPAREDDLLVVARGSRVVAFDNMSCISLAMSDALCRLATGSGLGKRRLYTDDEEVVVEATCAIVVNGIGEIIQQSDLQDRTIDVALRPLQDGEFRPLDEVLREFEAATPRILGALLDAVALALRSLCTGKSRGARMADFETWVEAGSPALGWGKGEFSKIYHEARKQARRDLFDANELAGILDGLTPFCGTATALLKEIKATLGETGRLPKHLPRSANTLSSEISRLIPLLRSAGILVERDRTRDAKRTRLIKLSRAGQSSTSSAGTLGNADSPRPPATRPEEGRLVARSPVPPSADAPDTADDRSARLGIPKDEPSDEDLGRMADEESERKRGSNQSETPPSGI